MNDQWGNRRSSGADTGIAQVLEIYATRGGRLEGARRWPQNPLTLTHVRWMSEYGEAVEAFCPPEDGAGLIWRSNFRRCTPIQRAWEPPGRRYPSGKSARSN
jgi:hypothetical protein